MRRKASVNEIQQAVKKHYAGETISGFEAGILRGLDNVIKQKQAESQANSSNQAGGYEDIIPAASALTQTENIQQEQPQAASNEIDDDYDNSIPFDDNTKAVTEPTEVAKALGFTDAEIVNINSLPTLPALHTENGQAEPATNQVISESAQTADSKPAITMEQAKNNLTEQINAAILTAKTEKEHGLGRNRKGLLVKKTPVGNFGSIRESGLDHADFQAIGYVTFDVEGDGKFKVLNTKEHLEEFKTKVEKQFKTPKQASYPTHSKRHPQASPETAIKNYIAKIDALSKKLKKTQDSQEQEDDKAELEDAVNTLVEIADSAGITDNETVNNYKKQLDKYRATQPAPVAEQTQYPDGITQKLIDEVKTHLANKVSDGWTDLESVAKVQATKGLIYSITLDTNKTEKIYSILKKQQDYLHSIDEEKSIFENITPSKAVKVWEEDKPVREAGTSVFDVAGNQRALMSNKAKARLNDEINASMERKSLANGWYSRLIAAYENGEFNRETKGLSFDARRYITRYIADQNKEQPAPEQSIDESNYLSQEINKLKKDISYTSNPKAKKDREKYLSILESAHQKQQKGELKDNDLLNLRPTDIAGVLNYKEETAKNYIEGINKGSGLGNLEQLQHAVEYGTNTIGEKIPKEKRQAMSNMLRENKLNFIKKAKEINDQLNPATSGLKALAVEYGQPAPESDLGQTEGHLKEAAKENSTNLAKKHEAYAQEIAGSGTYQREEVLKKAREYVKERYESLKEKQVSFNPDLSIKDAKVGDYVIFPANSSSRTSSYGGKIKKINRSTIEIESQHMGEPTELRVKWGENGHISRGNELIVSRESDYKQLNEMLNKLGITPASRVGTLSMPTEAAPAAKGGQNSVPTLQTTKLEPEKPNDLEQPKLTSQATAKLLADSVRNQNLRAETNKDGTVSIFVGDTHVATLKNYPQSADEAAAQILKNYRTTLDNEGKKLPSSPYDMSRDEFLIANKFGKLIADFEIDGAEIGGTIKADTNGFFQIDHDALYDKIQSGQNSVPTLQTIWEDGQQQTQAEQTLEDFKEAHTAKRVKDAPNTGGSRGAYFDITNKETGKVRRIFVTNGLNNDNALRKAYFDMKKYGDFGKLKNSISTAPQNAHSPTTLRVALAKIFGAWLNRLIATGKFQIISREQAIAMGANPNAQAFYSPESNPRGLKKDTTYLVADNIDTRTNLKKLLLHEIGVHALQLGRNSAQFKAIQQQLKNLMNRPNISPALKAAIAAAEKAGTSAELMNEEILGYLVEFHPELNIAQKVIAFFREQLRKLGMVNELTEQDIVYMASQALKAAPESLLFPSENRGKTRESNAPRLAPNGKPSNLNALQYAQVRTAAFKAWFGDWEAAANINWLDNGEPVATMQGEEIPVIKGMANLADWIAKNWQERGENVINRADIGEIHIDRRAAKDSAAHGLSRAKVQGFYLIPEVLKNGRLLGEMPQQPNKPKAVVIAAPVKIGDAVFKMYVEIRQDANMQRMYVHEVVLRTDSTTAFKTSAANLNDAEPQGANRGAMFSFIQNLRNVNVSKVVDENGEPLVVYHGTGGDFNVFDKNKIGIATDSGDFGKGFYFTPDPLIGHQSASDYAMQSDYAEAVHKGLIMPVFLDIKKPHITLSSLWGKPIPDKTEGVIVRKTTNHDLSNFSGKITEIVAFEPNQIKSATGNSGAFSSEDNDIRYSLRSNLTDFFTGRDAATQTLSDVLDSLNSGKPKTTPIDKQYWFDKIVTNFTDLSRPFDRWVQDTFNPIESQLLINGKDRAQGMKQAYEKEAMDKFGRPLADAIRAIAKQTGMKFQTAKDMAGYWMSATYAPEANAWLLQKDQNAIDDLEQQKFDAIADYNSIANPSTATRDKLDKELDSLDKQIREATTKRNQRQQAIDRQEFIDLPKIKQDLIELRKNRTANASEIQRLEAILEENVGLAGGLNNYTAQELIKQIEAKIPRDLLKAAATPVYGVLKWKLQNDIKDGKVSQDTVNTWNNSPNYVPLTGDPRTDDSIEDVFTTGSLNQQKDHAIQGRTGSIAQNAIDAAFEQVEKSARYHGWNEFKDSLHSIYNRLLAERMAQGLNQTEAIKELRDEYGINRRAADTNVPAGDNDIVYRKDNQGFIYSINNAAAMEALHEMTSETVPTILKPFGLFTTLQAKLVTMMMAGFAPTNFIRDSLEKSENIRTRTIQGYGSIDMNQVGRDTLAHAARLATTRLKMMAAVLAEDTPLSRFLSYDPNDTEVKQLKEYLRLGGSATYGELLNRNTKELSEQLSKLNTKLDKGWSTLILYNNAFETISGFSAYKALIEQGVPPKIAAAEALNLMNFRKRGRILSPLRSLYMFLNPTAQGAQQLARTLSTPRGRLRLASYTVAAALLYSLLRGFDGDDEDELGFNRMDAQGNYSLYRNIHIPIGEGQYLKIPLGFGMQQIAWAHGVNLARTYFGSMSVPEMLAESALVWQKAVMPIAPAESSFTQNPMVFMAQTFTPQIFKPLVNVALDRTAFGSPLTNARYEKLDTAKALQGRKTTPQEYKDLAKFFAEHGIDVYPEQLREVVRGYLIGHLGDVLKLAIENPNAEKLARETVTPSLDRWITPNRDEMLKTNRYYRIRDEMNEAAVKRSTGGELTARESELARLSDQLKRLEARTRGKLSTATKAEKLGQMAKAENYRRQAEQGRERYINIGLEAAKKLS